VYATLRNVDGTVFDGTSYLYAWLDGNQDGLFATDEQVQFEDPNDPEGVLDYLPLTDGGLADASLLVPSLGTVVGETFMRFRLSPAGPDEGRPRVDAGGGETAQSSAMPSARSRARRAR
jgi:hypothetical protein